MSISLFFIIIFVALTVSFGSDALNWFRNLRITRAKNAVYSLLEDRYLEGMGVYQFAAFCGKRFANSSDNVQATRINDGLYFFFALVDEKLKDCMTRAGVPGYHQAVVYSIVMCKVKKEFIKAIESTPCKDDCIKSIADDQLNSLIGKAAIMIHSFAMETKRKKKSVFKPS